MMGGNYFMCCVIKYFWMFGWFYLLENNLKGKNRNNIFVYFVMKL